MALAAPTGLRTAGDTAAEDHPGLLTALDRFPAGTDSDALAGHMGKPREACGPCDGVPGSPA